eukprot:CAMPEP_0117575962 /NCGR_PEP_ID=MMETSP0784-20121206/62519_1 /TAXON_ID=39447 /ORGANISM="" /LENGTH=76 /DNA_ID=CAMNT_0005375133 /DNA_START=1028 /DNA_END=1254 /DNA_ORIENTATION=+
MTVEDEEHARRRGGLRSMCVLVLSPPTLHLRHATPERLAAMPLHACQLQRKREELAHGPPQTPAPALGRGRTKDGP